MFCNSVNNLTLQEMMADRMDALHMNPIWGETSSIQATKGKGDQYYEKGHLIDQKPGGY